VTSTNTGPGTYNKRNTESTTAATSTGKSQPDLPSKRATPVSICTGDVRCWWVLVRMTPEGEVLGKARIDNDPAVFAEQIALMGEAPEVVLEATYGWYWAVDLLAEHGVAVHLAHRLGVKVPTAG